MTLHNFFFKYRSFTPLPFAVLLLYLADLDRWSLVSGIPLIALGELIRLMAVRIAGGRTRTRRVGANKLATTGIYGHVRNPLYIGNVLIYCGMAVMAGGSYWYVMVAIALAFFGLQYALIIRLEEETLQQLFGAEYTEYKRNVPPLLPRWIAWQPDAGVERVPWSKVLRAERSTLFNQVTLGLLLAIKALLA